MNDAANAARLPTKDKNFLSVSARPVELRNKAPRASLAGVFPLTRLTVSLHDAAPSGEGAHVENARMSAEQTLFPRAMSLAVHELRTPVTVVSGYLRMLLRLLALAFTPR